MKNDAIINGKTVLLSKTETERAAAFHKSRLPFAWIRGTLVFNNNANDDRDHQHWLLEDFGILPDEWEKTPRGYMIDGRIQLFIGSDFRELEFDIIPKSDITSICRKYYEVYKKPLVQIYNGVKVGKVGEIWKPIKKIGTFATNI